MMEDFNELEKQVNSYISSSQTVLNSSASPSGGKHKPFTNRESPLQHWENKHSEQQEISKHPTIKHLPNVVPSQPVESSSFTPDTPNMFHSTSEVSSRLSLPQSSQKFVSQSKQLPNPVSSSSSVDLSSDIKPVVKIEPCDDNEYDQSELEDTNQFSEDNQTSMYMVPNMSMTGEPESDQGHTVTHSAGSMYFSTPSDNEALNADSKTGRYFCLLLRF